MRRWWVMGMWAGLAVLALGAGCRARAGARVDRRTAQYEARLVRTAARDSRCPGHLVQPVRVAESVWVVNTCNQPREYFLQCRDPRRMSRCRWRRISTVPESAAAFLGCPPPAIQQMGAPQTPLVRTAVGCGRQVNLALQCNGAGCGWMAMGPPTAGGQAPPPPPGYGAGGQGTVVVVPAN